MAIYCSYQGNQGDRKVLIDQFRIPVVILQLAVHGTRLRAVTPLASRLTPHAFFRSLLFWSILYDREEDEVQHAGGRVLILIVLEYSL